MNICHIYDDSVRMSRDECGATAIEYSLIGALLSISVFAGAQAIGGKFGSIFPTIAAVFP
jgi:Flp pilus assembly pilin Flp